MRSTGVKALKNRLSEFVRADAWADEQRLGALARQGLLAPAKLPPKARLPRRKPVMKYAELLRGLDDDRAER